jgi:hypothetical protein
VPDIKRDEDLMERFLLGTATEEERDHLEERFLVDHGCFEALCAMEDEIILAHLRQELPADLEQQFRTAVLAAPARRRRVEEMRALVAAAEAVATPWWKRLSPSFTLVAAAAIAILVVTVSLVVARRPRPPTAAQPSPSPGAARTASTQSANVATLFLWPGVRALGPQPNERTNQVRIEPGAKQLRLRLIVTAEPGTRITAMLHPAPDHTVTLAVPSDPVVRETRDGLDVTWEIPVSVLQPGSYDLTIKGQTDSTASEDLTSRSFTVK